MRLTGLQNFAHHLHHREGEVFVRITALPVAILYAVDGALTDSTRAIGCLLTGRFCQGLKNLASAIIQLIALPLLGLLATVSPTKAYNHILEKKDSGDRSRNCATNLALKTLAIPLAVARRLIHVPIELLRGHPCNALKNVELAVQDVFLNLGRVFMGGTSANTVYESEYPREHRAFICCPPPPPPSSRRATDKPE